MNRFISLAIFIALLALPEFTRNAAAQEANQAPLEPSAVVIKKHSYIQLSQSGGAGGGLAGAGAGAGAFTIGDNTNVNGSGGGPWGFSAYVSSAYGQSQTITAPVTVMTPGGTTVTLTLNSTDGAYEYNQEFSSQAALDAAYPNGSYTISFGGHGYSFTLTGDTYPAPSSASAIQSLQGSSSGTWNNGTQIIDPTQSVAFLFSYSTNFVTGSARMTLDVTGPTYANLQTSRSYLTVNQLLMQIAGGTLSTGSTYLVHGTLDNLIGLNTGEVPGLVISGVYEAEIDFNMQAGQIATPAPTITTQPQSQSVNVGGNVTFSIQATVVQPATYQWYLNGTAISGATSSTYSISGATAAQAGTYTAAVSDAGGTTTSSGGTLTVNTLVAPSIVSQPPATIALASGSTVSFRVQISGSPAPTYQWYLNGNAISGATSQEYVITDATAANAGSYTVTATNSQGSVTSNATALTFKSTTNVGRLINISVNTLDGLIGTPEALTVGFVTGGAGTSGSQSLLFRADGPVLAGYGVPTGFLADPQLTVLSGSTSLATNAGWGTPSSNVALVQAAEANTFAFAFPSSTSLDSAAVISLPAAGYTVQVAGKSDDTGTTVAEIYDDTTQGTYALTAPRLINLSCKLQVAASGVLTEGFTVGGTSAKTVLIRASGPALTAYGVTGVMPDPQLTLFNSSNIQIAHNAGWGGDAQITAAMSEVHAFLYTDATSTDSAILVTLTPGSYTAQGSSVSGASGTVLIEVYEVP